MQERRYISKRQYRFLLASSLMLVFTTPGIPAFLSSCVQLVLFFLINQAIFRKVSNKRVCWGVFAFSAAFLGEVVGLLSRLLMISIPTPSMLLLPCSSFLFLSAPVFQECADSDDDGLMKAGGNAFLFYFVDGLLISLIREAFGAGTIAGFKVDFLSSVQFPWLSQASGAALLVLVSLLLVSLMKRRDTEIRWSLRVQEDEEESYPGISLPREKKTLSMMLGLLVFALVSGGVGSVLLLYAPSEIRRPEHIVVFATVITILVFTLIVKVFHLADLIDEQRFLPLAAIIMVALPMEFYLARLGETGVTDIRTILVWWISMVVGVWLTFAICLLYVHVIHSRLMFGKQPRCLEGVPFVILHILLVLIVLMPWLDVLQNV